MKKLAGLVAFLVLVACQQQPTAPEMVVPAQQLRQPAFRQAGAELFARHCKECHGSLAEGRNPRAARFVPPAPDFHELRYRSSAPAYLFWRIAKGRQVEPFRSRGSVMPAWQQHLSETQIWQLVAYLRQRSGVKN